VRVRHTWLIAMVGRAFLVRHREPTFLLPGTYYTTTRYSVVAGPPSTVGLIGPKARGQKIACWRHHVHIVVATRSSHTDSCTNAVLMLYQYHIGPTTRTLWNMNDDHQSASRPLPGTVLFTQANRPKKAQGKK